MPDLTFLIAHLRRAEHPTGSARFSKLSNYDNAQRSASSVRRSYNGLVTSLRSRSHGLAPRIQHHLVEYVSSIQPQTTYPGFLGSPRIALNNSAFFCRSSSQSLDRTQTDSSTLASGPRGALRSSCRIAQRLCSSRRSIRLSKRWVMIS